MAAGDDVWQSGGPSGSLEEVPRIACKGKGEVRGLLARSLEPIQRVKVTVIPQTQVRTLAAARAWVQTASGSALLMAKQGAREGGGAESKGARRPWGHS